MPFVRVRGKTPGDPLHEFDVTVAEADAHPDRYEVIEEKPVATSRPASFMPGTVKTPRPAKKRTVKRTGETKPPRQGHDS
jgi:hypothetical protein